ncbi:hypothetical protein RAHE111665_09765 [Rariglobus hedericola]
MAEFFPDGKMGVFFRQEVGVSYGCISGVGLVLVRLSLF